MLISKPKQILEQSPAVQMVAFLRNGTSLPLWHLTSRSHFLILFFLYSSTETFLFASPLKIYCDSSFFLWFIQRRPISLEKLTAILIAETSPIHYRTLTQISTLLGVKWHLTSLPITVSRGDLKDKVSTFNKPLEATQKHTDCNLSVVSRRHNAQERVSA